MNSVCSLGRSGVVGRTGQGRDRDRRGGGDAELVFDLLDEVPRLEHGHAADQLECFIHLGHSRLLTPPLIRCRSHRCRRIRQQRRLGRRARARRRGSAAPVGPPSALSPAGASSGPSCAGFRGRCGVGRRFARFLRRVAPARASMMAASSRSRACNAPAMPPTGLFSPPASNAMSSRRLGTAASSSTSAGGEDLAVQVAAVDRDLQAALTEVFLERLGRRDLRPRSPG